MAAEKPLAATPEAAFRAKSSSAPAPVLHRSATNASLLRHVDKSQQVHLEFTNVNAFVPVLFQGSSPAGEDGNGDDVKGQKEEKERQILFDVSGVVKPGEVLALMGPSGSGKSSLLTLLGARSKAKVSGDILFNGQPMTKAIKRRLGFVTQDDLLYAELTVYETLYYAAMLRLPYAWPKDMKLARVEMVLQGLGLSKCRDTIIGNMYMRGVSGGERKRACIGHELLINPSVLFLDEPTSGLDSTTALKLIHTLRSLASGGRTIVASIHQPSSRLYQQMDKLLLLSEGRTLYYGDAHASAAWFGQASFPVPFGVSTPDHLLDLACGDLPGRSEAESQEAQQALVELFKNRKIGLGVHGVQPSDFEAHVLRAAGLDSHGTPSTGSEGEPDVAGIVSTPESLKITIETGADAHAVGDDDEQDGPSQEKWGAPWHQQVALLTSRCIRTRRFASLSWQRITEVIVVAVLSGMFWWQLGAGDLDDQKVRDLAGLLFFQVLFMSFSSMFQALFTFPLDLQMLVKERQSGMYRLSAYYTARFLSDIPMDCLMPTIFCWIIYWMSGLRVAAGSFFCNWFAMLLTMLVAQGGGLFLGATVEQPKTSLAIATIFMLCMMLCSGFYVAGIPVWIEWVKYISFIYYGFNLLLKIEFSDRGSDALCVEFYKANPDAAPGRTYCQVAETNIITVNPNKSTAEEACVLFGMLIFIRICVYFSLKHRTAK